MAIKTSEPVSDRFARLSAQWKQESEFMSNTAQMALLRSYQSIIGMGERAIPMILEELRREPGQWFWALEAITLENPVPPAATGKVDEMARAWVTWGLQNGYIS